MKQLDLSKKRIEKTHVLQHDQSDCGVVCLLALIKLYNGHQSLEKLREISGTTKQGTTLLGLFQAAYQLGFDAQGCESDMQGLLDHGQPVILHVLLEQKLQHYVVCYNYDEKKGFLIGDPGKGMYYLSKKELKEIWVFHTCLTLSPNADFVTQKETRQSQKEWFLNLLKEDYQLLWISILFGVFVAGLGLAMAIFSQKLIDDILPSKNFNKLITGIALLSILLLARVGFLVLREYFLIRQSKDFNNRINGKFYDALLYLPKPFFDTRKIGELIARLNDTQRVQRVIKQLASSLVIDILTAIISMVVLFTYSWHVGLIALVSLPLYFLIIYKSNKKIINAQKEVMQGYALNESNYVSSMQGIATIKNNNRQPVFAAVNKTIFGNFQERIFNLGRINISLSWQSGLASVLFLMTILSFASFQVFYSVMELGELMALLGISGMLMPSVANLALVAIPINEAKIAFNRMYEFASITAEKNDGETLEQIDAISLVDTSFRFPGKKQLFTDVSIDLERGKLAAIVGESGSGKSTIGQVLQGFYKIENGQVLINDDLDLDSVSIESYRDFIAVVPQEISIFPGTVIDNILLGREESPEKIQKFIHKFGFDKLFSKFPQGVATILGEEGINLSGGQKQIVAFARALYKKPQLLILDEATAAMDRNTEKFVLNLLAQLKPHCAILFISHRLHSLPKLADTIYVLENGTISAVGSHNELLEGTNFYSEFWLEAAVA